MCLNGFYRNGSNSCVPCDNTCKTCVTSSTNCLTCDYATQDRLLNTSNNCICKDGFYDNAGTCAPCDPICKTCTTTSSNCTSCFGNTDFT